MFSASFTTQIAQIIQLAVAPVFLLAGVGAFLDFCASRPVRQSEGGDGKLAQF